jgi:di/tricarboxylate transporter
VGLALFLVPTPPGLSPNAWSYFALFAAVVVGLILEPIPAAAIGLLGVTAAGVFRLVETSPAASITWALSGFQDRTVWLIFGAFVFSIGYGKTGLGRRVALLLVRRLGGEDPGPGLRHRARRPRAGPGHAVEHGPQRGVDLSRDPGHPRPLR